jgi:hypothetical protein
VASIVNELQDVMISEILQGLAQLRFDVVIFGKQNREIVLVVVNVLDRKSLPNPPRFPN